MLKKIIMASLLTTGFYAQAESNISYSYLEAGYNYTEVDGGGNADGPYFLGSFNLSDSFYLGGYYDRDSTRNVDLDEYGLFLGYHFSQSDRTDFFTEFNAGRADSESTINGIDFDRSSTIYGLDIGTRTAFTNNFELISEIGYVYNERASDGFVKLGLKGLFKFGQSSGLTLGVEVLDGDALIGSIGYRYSL